VTTREPVVAAVCAAFLLGVGLWAQSPPRDPHQAPVTNPVKAGAVANSYSYVDGKRWDFAVSRKDIEDGPRWLNTDDSPPLPPGAAITAARQLLPQLLPDSDMDKWRVASVALNQILLADAWDYEVTFRGPSPCELAPPPGNGGCGFVGGLPEMRMVVLMNGHAVVPVATKWPSGS
jgi:hypothetical protein